MRAAYGDRALDGCQSNATCSSQVTGTAICWGDRWGLSEQQGQPSSAGCPEGFCGEHPVEQAPQGAGGGGTSGPPDSRMAVDGRVRGTGAL